MSILKKLFGTLSQKPWEENQVNIDNRHAGSTFKGVSSYVSAVIVIFGVSTVLFSLIVTAYLYSIPGGQDTMFLFKPNLFWFNSFVLILVAYIFRKITKDLGQRYVDYGFMSAETFQRNLNTYMRRTYTKDGALAKIGDELKPRGIHVTVRKEDYEKIIRNEPRSRAHI